MIASLPVDNTLEALRVLQAHGWKARGFCFWRHIPGGKETLYSPARGGWYCITGSAMPRCLGGTLADAAYRLHGDEMLDAGLGALLLRGLSFEMGVEEELEDQIITGNGSGELKPSYWKSAAEHCRRAVRERMAVVQPLFAATAVEAEDEEMEFESEAVA